MICRRCQNAMRRGLSENICYRTGEKVVISKESCRLCRGSISSGKLEVINWNRSHNGRMTSQMAKDNLRIRFGNARRKRCQISVSEDVAKKFYEAVPENARRSRIDHAILVEIGEVKK